MCSAWVVHVFKEESSMKSNDHNIVITEYFSLNTWKANMSLETANHNRIKTIFNYLFIVGKNSSSHTKWCINSNVQFHPSKAFLSHYYCLCSLSFHFDFSPHVVANNFIIFAWAHFIFLLSSDSIYFFDSLRLNDPKICF